MKVGEGEVWKKNEGNLKDCKSAEVLSEGKGCYGRKLQRNDNLIAKF